MSNDGANKDRRRFLLATTSVVGAVGAGLAAVPFIKSWQPSARAQAAGAPVEVDLTKLEPGQLLTVEWRGRAIGILRRTQEMLDGLPALADRLRDPDSEVVDQQPGYAKNQYRSINPDYLVLNINCTHLGCVPQVLPQPGSFNWEPDWPGGFFCPCHKSKFDLAGRVFKGVPAPTNLIVPPYSIIDNRTLIIGVDPQGAA